MGGEKGYGWGSNVGGRSREGRGREWKGGQGREERADTGGEERTKGWERGKWVGTMREGERGGILIEVEAGRYCRG